jgi:predicted Zn-dependent peptidase
MKNLFLALALILPSLDAGAALRLRSDGMYPNYLFEQDPKALASSVQLVFQTGSMADPKGKEGLASLAFHSLLRGTQAHTKEQFFAEIERLGASLDVDVGPGRVIMNLTTLSDNLEPAIQLMAEAVLHPSLKDGDIDSLKEEYTGMLGQELTNNRRILKRVFRQALFHGTTLAFPPEGTIKGIQAVTAGDVRSFLSAQIDNGNAIVAVSSDRSETDVKDMLERAFTALPDGTATALTMPIPEHLKGRTVYVVDRPGSTTTEIAFGHYGIIAADPDRDALETGLYSFGAGANMTSILFEELREKKGWTYGSAAGFDLFERPRRYEGGFMVWAFPQAEHTEELVLRAMQLYEDYSHKGLTKSQLDFAKQSLSNSYPFVFATSRSRLTDKLYDRLEGAPHEDVAAYRKIIGKITNKSLLAAIKKVHDSEDIAIVLVGDPAHTEGLLKSIPHLKKIVKVTDPMALMM